MFVKRGPSATQKIILSCLSVGATIGDIASAVYRGNEPDYAYDSIRVMIYRLRKEGFVISNKPGTAHSGKTGRGTPAFYKLLETPTRSMSNAH
jgi:hypothetical protein